MSELPVLLRSQRRHKGVLLKQRQRFHHFSVEQIMDNYKTMQCTNTERLP